MKIWQIFITILALSTTVAAQTEVAPFLEIRPYEPPENQQYPAHALVDHTFPTQTSNGEFKRLDGFQTASGFPPASNCIDGISCYDGHSGTDFWMPKGTPLMAPAPGTVVWSRFGAGVNPCPGGSPPNGDLGVLIISHGNDYFSTFLHMDSLNAGEGQLVQTGDVVAFSGNTGCASIPHLHYEMRKGSFTFNQKSSWVVNPYGWWGVGADPIKTMRGNASVWLWKSSELIDDGDNGFERIYGPNWTRLTTGYQGDAWMAPAVASFNQSRCWAIWVPELAADGKYEIQVSVPSIENATTGAVYEIYTKLTDGSNQKTDVIFDQTAQPDSFVSLHTMELRAGANCAVILRDVVAEGSAGAILFDAVRFVRQITTDVRELGANSLPNDIQLLPNYPNPFTHAGTHLVFRLQRPNNVQIRISNVLGQTVRVVAVPGLAAGRHAIRWNGNDNQNRALSAGIYFAQISAGQSVRTGKLLLLSP